MAAMCGAWTFRNKASEEACMAGQAGEDEGWTRARSLGWEGLMLRAESRLILAGVARKVVVSLPKQIIGEQSEWGRDKLAFYLWDPREAVPSAWTGGSLLKSPFQGSQSVGSSQNQL